MLERLAVRNLCLKSKRARNNANRRQKETAAQIREKVGKPESEKYSGVWGQNRLMILANNSIVVFFNLIILGHHPTAADIRFLWISMCRGGTAQGNDGSPSYSSFLYVPER